MTKNHRMQFSAAQIALLVEGRVEGDPNVVVDSFGKIEEAGAGQLAFLANPKYEDYLYTTGASVIIINDSQELKQSLFAAPATVSNYNISFATLLAKYQQT